MIKKYGRKTAGEYVKKAKPIYREMLEQSDDIGAKNPMASNIYMAFVFMAIWRAANGAVTPDDMREITRELLGMELIRRLMGGMDVNKEKDMNKLKNMLHKNAKWIEEHHEYRDKSWDFNFDETPNVNGVSYHFTRCPLCNYARVHGYMEILPVMCEMDFLTAKLYHARLYREHTLADGGDMCDYLFVGDQE
ncbi:MAG: L-2-amino-thiazoline-4-carboxylic acid hydrolase [Oscillospiraceae bacterium]|nr:L-2-amino-thiazoline-4-carboxylic acid hydrolase [Oscillospiraceae bacterium]